MAPNTVTYDPAQSYAGMMAHVPVAYARGVEGVVRWMAARRYRARTVRETVSSLVRLARLRESGWSRPPAGAGGWLATLLRRLEGAAAEVGDPTLIELVAYGRALLPPRDAHARLRGVAARRPTRYRDARAFDDDAWRALCHALEERDDPASRVLRVLAATGLRVGDVLRIDREAARKALREGTILLELKGGRRWRVSLDGAPDEWRALLEPFARSRAPDVAHYVAPGQRVDHAQVGACGAYQRVRRTLQKLCAELRINEDVWTHRIRRTVGVRAYQRTTDVLAVRDLLGHASPKTTLVYLDEARQERAVELQRTLRAERG